MPSCTVTSVCQFLRWISHRLLHLPETHKETRIAPKSLTAEMRQDASSWKVSWRRRPLERMDKLIPQWWRGAEASKWACHIFRVHIGYSTFFSQPNYYFGAMIIFLFYPGRPITLVSLGLQSRLPHGFVNPALLKRCRKKCDYLKHK